MRNAQTSEPSRLHSRLTHRPRPTIAALLRGRARPLLVLASVPALAFHFGATTSGYALSSGVVLSMISNIKLYELPTVANPGAPSAG